MCVEIKGTTPGVEWGKELSLLVKEQSSPISHEVWVDADNPAFCYIYTVFSLIVASPLIVTPPLIMAPPLIVAPISFWILKHVVS